MPNVNELANLRDIQLPPAVSAWPPGPAYYALMALFIIFILIFIKYKQRRQYIAPRREALLELTAIEVHYEENLNVQKTAAEVNALLKRVALVYHPRADVASLHGQAWLRFLKRTSQQIDFDAIQTSLLDAPFNPHSQEDLSLLLLAARCWIKQRRRQCSN